VDAPVSVTLRAAVRGAEATVILGGTHAVARDTAMAVPAWAHEVVLEVEMPDDDWAQLTDFGVSVRDRLGRIIGAVPLNYANGRMRLRIPPAMRGDTLRIRLSPAAAAPDPPVAWQVSLTVRFLLDTPVLVDPRAPAATTVVPGATVGRAFQVTRWPAPPPDGWSRLLEVSALDNGAHAWTREVVLPSRQGTGR
jgi:hypothetical protein